MTRYIDGIRVRVKVPRLRHNGVLLPRNAVIIMPASDAYPLIQRNFVEQIALIIHETPLTT